jgi:thiol-disulfide isomerase/thioredoxin
VTSRGSRLARGAVFLLCASCASRAQSNEPGYRLGSRPASLEALNLPSVGAADYRVEDLSGKVVLVSFLATWCFPCLAEIPALRALQAKYGFRGFRVVGMGMDLEGARVLDPFARHYELNFPVLLADEGIRRGLQPYGQIKGLPSTFLLGRDGAVLIAFEGVANPTTLEKLVEGALK